MEFVTARVKLIDADFLELSLEDVPLRDIKVVLVSALCTKSAIVNPVNFLIQEDDGTNCVILGNFWEIIFVFRW